MKNIRLAIIGTAGRDKTRTMDKALYNLMFHAARAKVMAMHTLGVRVIAVSGGAAWSDHIAVSLFLSGVVLGLELYMPCEFKTGDKPAFVEEGSDKYRSCGGVANYYHRLMSEKLGQDAFASRRGIARAIGMGAKLLGNGGGFHARNALVASAANLMLAFTWGEGEVPTDGGTAHTWSLCKLDERAKLHIPLGNLLRGYKGIDFSRGYIKDFCAGVKTTPPSSEKPRKPAWLDAMPILPSQYADIKSAQRAGTIGG